MNERHPMTPLGHKKLVEELRYHKEVLRHKIVKDIEEARAHGDISENSEYEDAKHRQGLCEGRIRELETKLALAEVIDITRIPVSERVVFGATVVLEDLETEEEVNYRIVGVDESDARSGLISINSPIARGLIGKMVGDEAVIHAPGGVRRFTITDVLYK